MQKLSGSLHIHKPAAFRDDIIKIQPRAFFISYARIDFRFEQAVTDIRPFSAFPAVKYLSLGEEPERRLIILIFHGPVQIVAGAEYFKKYLLFLTLL